MTPMKPESKARLNGMKVANRKAGLCAHCSRPAVPGRQMCEHHLAWHRAYQRKRRERLAGSGLCQMCGAAPIADGTIMCRECRARSTARLKARYSAARDAGLCPRCGGPRDTRRIWCSDCSGADDTADGAMGTWMWRSKVYGAEALARMVGDAESLTDAERAELERIRPRTRGDCACGIRPCPWVGCRYHLYVDAGKAAELKVNHAHLEPWELQELCALDVAGYGGLTEHEVGEILGVSGKRVGQIERGALIKLRTALGDGGFRDLMATE